MAADVHRLHLNRAEDTIGQPPDDALVMCQYWQGSLHSDEPPFVMIIIDQPVWSLQQRINLLMVGGVL